MANRIKIPAVAVPQTREQFEASAVTLGELMRSIDRINSDVADTIAKAKLSGKETTLALAKQADALERAIFIYAAAHRDELLPRDRKSVTIAAGTIGWRMGKAKVAMADADEVLETIERLGLEVFLRTSVEIDKTALLADPETARAIPGVEIVQNEELFFRPLDLDEERVRKSPSVSEAA